MIIKYKVSEVAKDLNKPAKQIIDKYEKERKHI